MITFLTERTDHNTFIYKSAKIKVSNDLNEIDKMLQNLVIDFDTEGNGGRYHISEVLLIQFGIPEHSLVVDFTDPTGTWRDKVISHLERGITEKHLFIGHNLKHDSNVCAKHRIKLPDFWDTMISSQRLNLGSGLLNNYKDVYERELKTFFPEDKAIREDFLTMNYKSRFEVKHIMYAGGDVGKTREIAKIHRQKLEETGQAWFVRNVEFPLIKVLSECELEGLDLNKDKWKALIQKKQQQKFDCEKAMDQMIVELGRGIPELTGGRYNNRRTKAQYHQTDMFGEQTAMQENLNKHNLNYNSREDIFKVMTLLKLPLPFMTNGKEEKDSLREEAIMAYLMAYPNSPLKSFFEKLLEFKGLQKFISSYGEKFLYSRIVKNKKSYRGFVNPVTGRVHTQLKQCFTDTGRLSSGEDSKKKNKKDKEGKEKDTKIGVFNVQNLPAEKEIREAFELSQTAIDAGYWFTTCDLSGAELVIMAALANDEHLYELGALKDDIHSPVATKCWRAVYQYRVSKGLTDLTIKDSKGKTYTLSADFLIDKDIKNEKDEIIYKGHNKQLRTDFKPMIFGVFYGLMAKKGSETLNIPKDEAQVVIDIIRREFPKTIKMLEASVRQAFRHGYVIFNNRSNNRRIFSPVMELLSKIDQKKYSDDAIIAYIKENLSFKEQVEITGEALNCRIQGTQADMIKESMVEVHRHPQYKATNAKLLLSVHDELGAKHIGKDFGEVMKNTMIEVANKYLAPYSNTIRMKAEAQTLHSWTK